MRKFSPKTAGPEAKIQSDIVDMLTLRGWYVKRLVGNQFQSGWPDLYATHNVYKGRFIEVKDPNRTGDVFTPAQHKEFPLLSANGTGVWVLVGANEREYAKLFKRENWFQFLQVTKL